MADNKNENAPQSAIPAVRAFNKELAPAFIDHVCITGGFAPPPGSPLGEGVGAGFAYCELHCGSAVTATLLAASNPLGDFHVIDPRGPMIESGRALAKDGKVRNITFHESDIEAALDQVFPGFDYIAVNGIYTWVPLRERALILSFVRKWLKPGGALYLSYNARPGWNKRDPFRRILCEALRGRNINVREGLAIARETYAQLYAAKAPALLNAVPPASLAFLDDLPPEALIADYANDFAAPLYVTEVAADFAAIDCALAGASDMAESLSVLLAHEPFKSACEPFPATVGKELAKDYLRDTMLRRDVFVRGGRRIAAESGDMILNGLAFALEQPGALVRYDAQLPFGEMRFDNPHAHRLVVALESGPQTLGELIEKSRGKTEDAQAVVANVHALLLSGQIRPVYRGTREAAESAHALATAIRSRAITSQAIGFLPSPFGTAFAVPIPDQLYMEMPQGQGAEAMAAEAERSLEIRWKPEILLRRARNYKQNRQYYQTLGLTL